MFVFALIQWCFFMNDIIIILYCFAAIFLSIYLGRKTKLNTGLFAIVLSYLIGGFLMDMPASGLISHFSIKILFLLMSISMFYGYAAVNGTLEALASRIIYRFRKRTMLLPFVLYLVCFLISCLGAAAPVVCSLMAPVCFAISAQTGIHPIIMSALIAIGSGAGCCVPWSSAGAIICGIAADTPYADQAIALSMKICMNFFLGGLVYLILVYIGCKGYKATSLTMDKPKALNRQQKQTLAVILAALSLLVIPGVVEILLPNPVTAYLAAHMDLQMIAVLGAVICGLLHLGDTKRVMNEQIPWGTIITVCGISMLLGVASEAGAIDMVVEFLGSNVSLPVICLTFILIGGFLSFFTGGVTVVIPMLVPIALSIFASRGGNLTLLASSAALGGLVTAVSPFSTGGSLVAASMPDEDARAKLVNQQILLAFVGWGLFAVFAVTGIFGIID